MKNNRVKIGLVKKTDMIGAIKRLKELYPNLDFLIIAIDENTDNEVELNLQCNYMGTSKSLNKNMRALNGVLGKLIRTSSTKPLFKKQEQDGI